MNSISEALFTTMSVFGELSTLLWTLRIKSVSGHLYDQTLPAAPKKLGETCKNLRCNVCSILYSQAFLQRPHPTKHYGTLWRGGRFGVFFFSTFAIIHFYILCIFFFDFSINFSEFQLTL